MVEEAEERPGWAESPLYEQGVAHFEAEEWEEAVSLFSQLAAEFPDDQELQRILAELRLKASLPRGESRGERMRMLIRRLGRTILLAFGVVALIAVLAGAAYAIYTYWFLPRIERRDQLTHLRNLHEECRDHLAVGDYPQAADCYRGILDEYPDDATAPDGVDIAEQLQELDAQCDEAMRLMEEEQWSQALNALRWIRAADPNFCDVDYWIPRVERELGLESLFTEAETCYGIQDWACVIEVLEQLRGQNANYRRDEVEALLVSSHVNLAEQMLSDASDPADVYNEVMEHFDKAIQIHPQDESILTERTVAQAYSQSFARFQEGECETALQELELVYGDELQSAPDQQLEALYQANIHCGDERVQAGDFQGARACYEAAMELPLEDVSEASERLVDLGPMLTPTATPIPPTPTPTRRPATPTPRPPTPTPAPAYVVSQFIPRPQCAFTKVEGWVFYPDGVTQRSGVRVKVWWSGGEMTYVTPSEGGMGSGYYAHTMSGSGPLEGHWCVAVVDSSGNPLSESFCFHTNTVNCRPSGMGHQWITVSFRASY